MRKKTIALLILCILMIFGLASCKTAEQPEKTVETLPAAPEETVDKSGKRVYFAAPLFSQAEKDFNLKITQILEENGYEVFLPQRDGFLAVELEGLSEEEMTKKIFEKDLSEVLKADIIFMILDGRIPDEGACVELGIAYANNKRCYGFKNDARVVETALELNPMISGCFTKLFCNYDYEKLVEELKQYLAENEL